MRKFTSGRGGSRYDKDGNLLTGRKATGKNKRINPTLSKANAEWFDNCGESASKLVNRLIDKERLVDT